MSQPFFAGDKPVVLDLEPGTYFWCYCGLSKEQPFCDGAHNGVGFHPIAFTLSEKKKVALCMCKQTNDLPFCDGTHKNVKTD